MKRLSALFLLAVCSACADDVGASRNNTTDAGFDTGLDVAVDGSWPDTGDAGFMDRDIDDAERPDMGPPEVPLQFGTTVDTASGTIEGQEDGDLRVFKGIPFAQPPVGDLRFHRPLPVEPWADPLVADDFGASCMQAYPTNFKGSSEDCLTLNVWAHQDGKQRPVMVWIYGGGFILGESSFTAYDAAIFAEAADVVVVSINYRLGLFGNLALPELRDEDAEGAVGNMGLLDQIEALRWVKRNAAAFGGDPNNITVFGESAGAISTCALLGAPAADDLFDKAIIQSGNCAMFAVPDDGNGGGTLAYGETAVTDLGCADAPDRLACLRGLDTQAIADHVEPLSLLSLTENTYPLGWSVDGVVLPKTPYQRFKDGEEPARPVIAGSNGNEAAMFTAYNVVLTRSDFQNLVAELGTDETTAAEVVDLYSYLDYPLAKDAFNAFFGEVMFQCNTYHATQAMKGPAYYYELDTAPLALMTTYGPLHTADIPLIFGNFFLQGIVPTFADLALSEQMQTAWGTFAWTGTPEWTDGWSAVTAADPQFMHIDLFPGMESDFQDGRCDALQRLGVIP